MYDSGQSGDTTFANVTSGLSLGSELMTLLASDQIIPGTPPGYQLCKIIYSFHPLGAILAEAPIKRAQGQDRIISVPRLGEARLVQQFVQTWKKIGKLGATRIIRNTATLSRVYGIASLAIGERGKAPSTALEITQIHEADIFFNVLDPLNTAGSLVLNQDPNSPEYLKQGQIIVNGQVWDQSRTIAHMNGEPLYIDWTTSAFGFVGRSVYQRPLYPLKSFVQSMITDQFVIQKAGLLVAKMETPSSAIDKVMMAMFGWKRGQIKSGVTGQVIGIGVTEDIETLNMMNLDKAYNAARINVIKNIASGSGMPATIIAQETLTEGFGEGSEDADKEAAYLTEIREEMGPLYELMDRVVMRKAWSPEFYRVFKRDYRELDGVDYETWFYECMIAFTATWPNPIMEPESEKAKTADVKMKSVIALLEVLLSGRLDPENEAGVILWAVENVNEAKELFASKLDVDPDGLAEWLTERADQLQEQAEAAKMGQNGSSNGVPKAPATFAGRS